jgi:Leucine-rich repeat (LRR) protein
MQKLLTGVFLLFFILLSSVAHSQDSDEIRWKRCPGSNKQCPQVIDANLKKCIAYFAKKPFEELLVEDYLRVTFLGCSNRGIIDITGIENFTNLIELNLETNEISDASLEKLYLSGNQISDITPVAGLTKMKELHFAANQVEDIGPLAELVQLELLVFDNNQVNDLSPLKGLTRLLWLDFPNNPSGDLSSIANLRSLEYLDASENYISDISMLKNLKELDHLYLQNNEISDISVLVNFKKLLRIGLQKNNIRDIKPLAGLKSIKEIKLNDNQISDISPIANLDKLKYLDVSGNRISEIKALTKLKELSSLFLQNNDIYDISPLAGLAKLETVSLLNNCIRNIGPIAGVKSVTAMEYQHDFCNSPNLLKRIVTKEWLNEQISKQCVDYDGKNDYSLKSDYKYHSDGIYYGYYVRNNLGRYVQAKTCRLPWNSSIKDFLITLEKTDSPSENYEVLKHREFHIYVKDGRVKGYSVNNNTKVGTAYTFLDHIYEQFGVRYSLRKTREGRYDILTAKVDGYVIRIVDMGEKYSVQFFEPGFYAAEISKQQ